MEVKSKSEQRPLILLADNGFRDYYKPSDILFDACALGRVLILSLWSYDANKRHISREDCVALNAMHSLFPFDTIFPFLFPFRCNNILDFFPLKNLHFCDFFCIFALRKASAAIRKKTPKAKKAKSFGGRRKIFARSPQEFAPPAARYCHGRGKLVTPGLLPCYLPYKSLFPRGSSPFPP